MYWIHQDGNSYGPYTSEQITQYAHGESLVSHNQQWIRFSNHPDFTHAQDQSPAPPVRQYQNTRLAYDWYRVSGENELLAISVVVTLILLFFFTTISMGFFLFLLFIGVVLVKIQQGNILGSGVRVTEKQFPRIHRLAQEAGRKLRMTSMPDVFVVQDPTLNAFALGFLGKKTVVLHSALVESLDDNELLTIIGHEFAHANLGHTVWTTLLGQQAGIGIPVISQILQLIFNGWSRKAEYSCDRAGFIACGAVNASVGALAKLAVGRRLFDEMDLHGFTRQKGRVDDDDIAKISEAFCDHPYVVNRIHAVREFADVHPEYDNNGVQTVAVPSFCEARATA